MSFFRNTGHGIRAEFLKVPQYCQPAQMFHSLIEQLLILWWQIVKRLKETFSVFWGGEFGSHDIYISGSFLNNQLRHFIIYAPPAEQESCRSKIQWQRHEEHCRETRSGSSEQIQTSTLAGGVDSPPRVGWMENQPWDSV